MSAALDYVVLSILVHLLQQKKTGKQNLWGFNMNLLGSNELFEDVLSRDLCIGCGACVGVCPYYRTRQGRTVRLFPCNLTEGRCHAYCPKAEVDYSELSRIVRGKPYTEGPLGWFEEIVIARAGENTLSGPFQSGGTVSALIAMALDNGLIDAAVLTGKTGLIPEGRLITQSREVPTCATSKFTPAPTLATLNKGIQKGFTCLGVVGTPCQVTAVAQMRSNPLGRNDFKDPISLVIGLFCSWALDTRKFIEMLTDRMDTSRVIRMDIPPPPAEALIVDSEDGRIEIPLNDVRPFVPRACQICPDMTSEWADVSVGVLEGRPDSNTLIVRSSVGRNLVDQAVKRGYLVTEGLPEGNLLHLRLAASNKKKKGLIEAREQGLLNSPGDGHRSAIRMDIGTAERIMAGNMEG